MKKKVLLIILVVVMVCGISSTALAVSSTYNGHCKYNFNVSATYNKDNELSLSNNCDVCYLESTVTGMRAMSTFNISGSCQAKMVNPNTSNDYDRWHWWDISIYGTASLNMRNYDNPGYYMRAAGSFGMWN